MEKKVRIEYLLSEEGRKKSLLAGGDGKEVQVVEADVTPEALELAHVSPDGKIKIDLAGRLVMDYKIDKYGQPRLQEVAGKPDKNFWDGRVRFDEPMSPEALIRWEKERQQLLEAKKAELEPELNRLQDKYEEEQSQKQKEEDKREAERERLEAEKLAWIARHGSDYLKRAVNLSYNCQRQYVTERAALEFSGYTLDFDNKAYWQDRACPSPEALEEVEKLIEVGYDAKVVWLTEPAWNGSAELVHPDEGSDYYDCEPFEPCEAVVVRGYLGKYDLVKEF